MIADPTAATQKGVGIGDPLADAKAAYPGLERRPGQSNDEHAPDTPHCTGKLADHRYIWFGNDPIRIIALSPTPMG